MKTPESFDDLTPALLSRAAEEVYRTLLPTAQIRWPLLSRRCGCELWVKHENHLPSGAFKVRGGLFYFHALCASGAANPAGVVAATRGNHGQSVAFAARAAGIPATIVVPEGNSLEKNRSMRALGATLVEAGRDFNEALDHAAALAADGGRHMIPSFDWGLVAGVASYGMELLRAAPDLDAIYVPIGLGSGICGLAAARRALNARAEIVGVVAEQAPAYAASFAAGRVLPAENLPDTIADGVACRVPDARALEVILRHVSRVVTVSEEGIMEAIRAYFTDTRQVAEGAGAAALAAVLAEPDRLEGKRIAAVLTGGNIDRALYRRILSEEA